MNFTQKPTLAFVDHSFHQKTRCTDFLREILEEKFIITDYWDYRWEGGEKISAEKINGCDYVLFFQILPQPKELKKIKAKIVWVPMYDDLTGQALSKKILCLLSVKILSFSAKVTAYCQKYGWETIGLKYFMNPRKYKRDIPEEGKHLFFWYRGNIAFSDLKKHFTGDQIDSFTIFSNPDPNYRPEFISEEDQKKFKIKVIENNFATNAPYLEIVSKANIFIAPRKKEGIGMSFLEAMAMGMCVIASNEATMNEYLKNNENGYLFNLNDKKIIDLSNWKEMQKNSQKDAEEGYKAWEKEKLKINAFILSGFIGKKINKFFFQLDYSRLFFLETLKKLKKILKHS